jgi:hypothetical protein
MDPVCKCGKHLDTKRNIGVEEIDGGVGDKNYKVAIVYCSSCFAPIGVMPTKDFFKDLVKEAMADVAKGAEKKAK